MVQIFEKAPFWNWRPESPPPPHFGKLQIWDNQSLLWNTPPPISENFRFGMTKVYSGIPPPPHFRKLQIWDDQSLLRNTPLPPTHNENCQRVQVREFQNAESYYMWRLYPTRITTRCLLSSNMCYWRSPNSELRSFTRSLRNYVLCCRSNIYFQSDHHLHETLARQTE